MGSLLWKAASTPLFMERGCGQGVSRAANLWGAEICLAWWTSHRNAAELCKEVRWGLHVWLHVWLHGLFPMQKRLRLGSPNTQNPRSSQIWNVWVLAWCQKGSLIWEHFKLWIPKLGCSTGKIYEISPILKTKTWNISAEGFSTTVLQSAVTCICHNTVYLPATRLGKDTSLPWDSVNKPWRWLSS